MHMHTRIENVACMHAPLVGVCVCMHACSCYMCMHVFRLASIKCFLKLKHIHSFIEALSIKRDLSKQQNKMSNVTTEKNDLKQSTDIDHSFNNKVSSIVDDYLFNIVTAKSGLKRKREAENIVGTNKSKKRLRRL